MIHSLASLCYWSWARQDDFSYSNFRFYVDGMLKFRTIVVITGAVRPTLCQMSHYELEKELPWVLTLMES